MRLSPLSFVVVLFAVALGARLALVAALRDFRVGPVGISSADDVQFDAFARQLGGGHGYCYPGGTPTSFRAPGWPLLLAGLYWLVGVSYPAAYILLCVLGSLACVLTYLLAREVLPEGTARLAGWLSVVYLPHAYFSTILWSEALFVPLLALGVWLFLRYLRLPSLGLLALAGLVLGYAALTRPFALLLAPVFAGLLLLQWRRQGRPLVVPGLVFTAAFAACLVPWTVRNQRVHGRPVLVATNGGSTFYGGNNDRVVGEWRLFGGWVATNYLPHRNLVEAQPDEVSHDKMEWRLGLDWLGGHWSLTPLLVVLKTARLVLWLPDFDGGTRVYLAARVLGYLPFLVLLAAGAWTCLGDHSCRGPAWLTLHGVLLATLVTAWVFWGSPRFRDANAPLLMVYAALGARTLAASLGRRTWQRPAEAVPARVPEVVSAC
jgi:4-amino-4-deoxy-L-arabinose transferase-like glycosyltransferase